MIDALLDDVLELRRGFGLGMVTALARVDGKPLGVIANDPSHLGGAIDAHGADKAARFMQLCDAFDLPLLFLCDTPGFMVGPAAERTATVRHFARMFVTGANLSVPTGTIVLRKGYGLGRAGDGRRRLQGAAVHASAGRPRSSAGWASRERSGSGMRRELEAIEDPDERERAFEATVAAAYERGKGINMAAYGEIDDVIDPADSRRWIATLFDDEPGRVVDADRQAPPERRRLVSSRPRSARSRLDRRRAAARRGCSTRTPSRSDTRSIARSSPGSSNATSRPQCSQTRWWWCSPLGSASLEPRLPVADVDPLDEPVLDQQIEHAVDARAAGRAARSAAQRVLDLDRAERARLAASSSMTRSRAPPRLSPGLRRAPRARARSTSVAVPSPSRLAPHNGQ